MGVISGTELSNVSVLIIGREPGVKLAEETLSSLASGAGAISSAGPLVEVLMDLEDDVVEGISDVESSSSVGGAVSLVSLGGGPSPGSSPSVTGDSDGVLATVLAQSVDRSLGSSEPKGRGLIMGLVHETKDDKVGVGLVLGSKESPEIDEVGLGDSSRTDRVASVAAVVVEVENDSGILANDVLDKTVDAVEVGGVKGTSESGLDALPFERDSKVGKTQGQIVVNLRGINRNRRHFVLVQV